jgi:hypothetical protein
MADEADHEHDENCDHDHDHEPEEGEIEITINPREEDLLALGISPEEFEAALMKTLEEYDQAIDIDDPDAANPLEDAEITLAGKVYRLQEIADIEITGGLDGLGEGDDDDDEEEEEEEFEAHGDEHPFGAK